MIYIKIIAFKMDLPHRIRPLWVLIKFRFLATFFNKTIEAKVKLFPNVLDKLEYRSLNRTVCHTPQVIY